MIKSLYLTTKLYVLLGSIIMAFILCVFVPQGYYFIWGILVLLGVVFLYDIYFVEKNSKTLSGYRLIGQQLSLGDRQYIEYVIKNTCSKALHVDIIDEMPVQFQYREIIGSIHLEALTTRNVIHEVVPLSRGVYSYGFLFLMVSSSRLGLVKVRVKIDGPVDVRVLPSIIQMKKYAMSAFDKTAHKLGVRKVRRVGENDEFEHIRNYAIGDNIKSINWKATSRRNDLMVNQFQDTRSQMVYCIVDKGRSMEMPFNGLTLLDYAINSTLVISNIVLQKYDKIGLMTFSNKMDNVLTSESSPKQLESIMQLLYAQETQFKEPDFQLLYYTIRKKIAKRSILILFTNFEDKYDMERNLYYFKKLNIYHLLVIVTFVNTEIEKASEVNAREKSDIYHKVIAQSAILDKENIVKELTNAGIQVILTSPENLSINVINKYLEIKAKRMK